VAKEIVDCGLWYLAEYENGEVTVNRDPKEFTSVEHYLRRQGRFKQLSADDIAHVESARDAKWEILRQGK
ncbi:MAG: pyruvate synthase subunit beta, partial [Raoultibacter sp.]